VLPLSTIMLRVLACSLVAGLASAASFSYPIVGTYFPNWAQYRPSPFTFTPSSLSSIISKVNVIWYAFAYFCPDSSMVQPYWVTQLGLCQGKQPFQLTYVEQNDPSYYSQLVAMKSQNSNLKVILSVGGWNFPSNFFSVMVASSANRQTFINSCLSYMQQYRLDGIDLDWEYPCSPARTDPVEITCTDFQTTQDAGGGSCSSDKANLLELVKEMRTAFGSNYLITIAGQADMAKVNAGFDVVGMSQYVDLWNLMTYDFTVSDIPDSSYTAPNQPLYAPKSAQQVSQLSTSQTILGYINLGVDPKKIKCRHCFLWSLLVRTRCVGNQLAKVWVECSSGRNVLWSFCEHLRW